MMYANMAETLAVPGSTPQKDIAPKNIRAAAEILAAEASGMAAKTTAAAETSFWTSAEREQDTGGNCTGASEAAISVSPN
jgi:hypothetical protein